jgi:hypothetical protein
LPAPIPLPAALTLLGVLLCMPAPNHHVGEADTDEDERCEQIHYVHTSQRTTYGLRVPMN